MGKTNFTVGLADLSEAEHSHFIAVEVTPSVTTWKGVCFKINDPAASHGVSTGKIRAFIFLRKKIRSKDEASLGELNPHRGIKGNGQNFWQLPSIKIEKESPKRPLTAVKLF